MISSVRSVFKALDPRHYLVVVVCLTMLFGAGFAGLNYVSNDFGLWRHREAARIWTLEKTSKYLLAHRYVPENFDAIMIGSSVSANLDTRRIEGFRVYNLSMSGGNITETGAAALAYLAAPGTKKLLIVSLYPYLTKNSGMKSFQIDENEVAGSLFSMIPVMVWISKIQHWIGAGIGDFDESVAGWTNFNASRAVRDMGRLAAELEQELRDAEAGGPAVPARQDEVIDAVALEELEALLDAARQKGLRIVAYYHPSFAPRHALDIREGRWAVYKAQMERLFQPGEIILDMNGPDFTALRADLETYYDGAHLSEKGTDAVLRALNQAMKSANLAE